MSLCTYRYKGSHQIAECPHDKIVPSSTERPKRFTLDRPGNRFGWEGSLNAQQATGILQFGSFEFDPRNCVLRQRGFEVHLSASQLRLLTLFLERPGELVTREQIARRLWEQTSTIDVPTGINTAVNRLRRHLQESPGDTSSIQTVIGLGYRFLPEVKAVATIVPLPAPPAAVEELQVTAPTDVQEPSQDLTAERQRDGGPVVSFAPPEAAETSADSLTQERSGTRKRWSGRVSWITGLAVCVTLILLVALRMQPRWRLSGFGAARGASVTELKTIASSPIAQITPDRTIGELTAAAVSPDGEIVAYADRFGVSVHWFHSGVERLLGVRPGFVVDQLDWIRDKSGLLMSGTDVATHAPQVWSVPLQGADLTQLLQSADRAVLSPDGKRMAFTRDQDQEVWEAAADGLGARRVIKADQGKTFRLLLWSPTGDHLVVTEASKAANDDVLDEKTSGNIYLCIDAGSGNVLDREGSVPMRSGYMLPNGQIFFIQNRTPGPTTGEAELMVVQTDAKSGRLMEPPRLVRGFGARHAQNLTASLFGRRFAAVLEKSEVDTFVANIHWPGPSLEEPIRLTREGKQNYPHAWTADGRSVLLETNSLKAAGGGTKFAIFRKAVDGSPPKLVAQLPDTAALAQLSPDGRWVLFMQFEGRPQRPSGIFRVAAEGGPAERVSTVGSVEGFRCSTSPAGRCIVREAVGQEKLVYYALDPLTGMGEEVAQTPWEPNRQGDWDLSPDGEMIAAARHDTLRPGIELISLRSHGTKVRELQLQGHGTTLGANWSRDGKTLFVECKTEAGFELLSMDLSGHIRHLRDSPSLIWAVPSRDGGKIAFPGLSLSSSVGVGGANNE